MSILTEMDDALFIALRHAVDSRVSLPVQFLLVLSSDARNEFMREMLKVPTSSPSLDTDRKYRNAVLATTHDEEMPRSKSTDTIFERERPSSPPSLLTILDGEVVWWGFSRRRFARTRA